MPMSEGPEPQRAPRSFRRRRRLRVHASTERLGGDGRAHLQAFVVFHRETPQDAPEKSLFATFSVACLDEYANERPFPCAWKRRYPQ